MKELRQTIRSLWLQPMFAGTVILTLAGANNRGFQRAPRSFDAVVLLTTSERSHPPKK